MIAILEAFQEAGILIPSRPAEVTLQTIDLLRETAEHLSSDAHKTRVEANGLLQGSLPTYQDVFRMPLGAEMPASVMKPTIEATDNGSPATVKAITLPINANGIPPVIIAASATDRYRP